jgi:hypothetical protein
VKKKTSRMPDIQIDRLINFETAADGTAGEILGIILTIDALSSLFDDCRPWPPPLSRAHGNPLMRITYPAEEFEIESVRTISAS